MGELVAINRHFKWDANKEADLFAKNAFLEAQGKNRIRDLHRVIFEIMETQSGGGLERGGKLKSNATVGGK